MKMIISQAFSQTPYLQLSVLSAMAELDPEFIQPQEHRPKPEPTEAENIPLIDLAPLESPNDDLHILAAKVGDACKNWGFFQVINHGVPLEFREKIDSVSRQFFSLPIAEKRKLSRDEVNPYGYYDTEHTKNVRDWKEVFDCTVKNPTIIPVSHRPDDMEVTEVANLWPENLPELREAVEEYAAEMEKLAYKLLQLIAMSMGLRKDQLNVFFKDQTSRLRLNHYPSCPLPHLTLGVGRHKDGGVLTILAQDDVGGLEVKRKTDGEWIFVKPVHDAYIINVGDIIQVWSNEKYESIEHRAMVNSKKERLSIPFFFNPAHYTWVEPMEELIDDKNPRKYKGYNWGKFLVTRNSGNFKKLGVENIQISDFKI